MGTDYLGVHRADDRRADHRKVGIGDEARCFQVGTWYAYWRDPARTPLRAVYNVPPDRIDEIVERVDADPSAPYLDLVGDIVGAGYGDEWESLKYVD